MRQVTKFHCFSRWLHGPISMLLELDGIQSLQYGMRGEGYQKVLNESVHLDVSENIMNLPKFVFIPACMDQGCRYFSYQKWWWDSLKRLDIFKDQSASLHWEFLSNDWYWSLESQWVEIGSAALETLSLLN